MTSMFDRFAQLANDPKTRAKLDDFRRKAQQAANDPKTRAKLDDVRRRFQGGSGGSGGTGPGTAR
jgi:hypothetical protein